MSAWNAEQQTITSFAPEPYPGYLGWERVDCGCCAGLEWGGSEPRECKDCGGGGSLAKHTASGILALYPGGPARGREAPSR